jgi:hypothetical protein
MTSFGQYIAGKTIAIVGPAPAPYDQTDEVNAHDVVYRTQYLATPDQVGHPEYPANVLPHGYGSRADIVYLNAGTTEMAADGQLDHQLPHWDWVVCKTDRRFGPSGLTNVRVANAPPMKAPGTQNQITGMLWDLTYFEPAKVTVFGANFYAAPLEQWYDESYINVYDVTKPNDMLEHTRSIHWHDQADNRRIVQMVRDLGWLVGDDRYLNALEMHFLDYNRLLELDMTRAHKANFP